MTGTASPNGTDSVQVSIEVDVSPAEAFCAFAEQIDQWYVLDRHTVPDFTRTVAIVFEPYVGGRLLDVHDASTGEGRELARVTAWVPGARLAFVDNRRTEVEVSFTAAGDGTRVTLAHRGFDRLPPEEAEHVRRYGWHATLLPWFGTWLRSRPTTSDTENSDAARTGDHPMTFTAVTPYLYYADAGAALAWLERVFGFGPVQSTTDDAGVVQEGEIAVGTSGLKVDVCGRQPGPDEGAGALLIVSVSDVDSLYERIRGEDVEVSEPKDEAYGPRQIHCTDPWGYRWYFWTGEAHYPEP